jgi:hypothetical protein
MSPLKKKKGRARDEGCARLQHVGDRGHGQRVEQRCHVAQ